MKPGWIAFDERVFYSESECETYESKQAHLRLAALLGIPFDKIAQAFDGTEQTAPTNADLADCLEQVGTRLARERRARGVEHLKRQRQRMPSGAHETPPLPPGSITVLDIVGQTAQTAGISTGEPRVGPYDDGATT